MLYPDYSMRLIVTNNYFIEIDLFFSRHPLSNHHCPVYTITGFTVVVKLVLPAPQFYIISAETSYLKKAAFFRNRGKTVRVFSLLDHLFKLKYLPCLLLLLWFNFQLNLSLNINQFSEYNGALQATRNSCFSNLLPRNMHQNSKSQLQTQTR